MHLCVCVFLGLCTKSEAARDPILTRTNQNGINGSACVCVKQDIESIIFVVKTAHTHTHTVTYVHYTCASNIVQHNLLASQTFPRSLFTFLCIAATRSLSLSACCSLLLPLVLPAFFLPLSTQTQSARAATATTSNTFAVERRSPTRWRGEIVRRVRAATKVNLLLHHALSLALTHTLLLLRLLLLLPRCVSAADHSTCIAQLHQPTPMAALVPSHPFPAHCALFLAPKNDAKFSSNEKQAFSAADRHFSLRLLLLLLPMVVVESENQPTKPPQLPPTLSNNTAHATSLSAAQPASQRRLPQQRAIHPPTTTQTKRNVCASTSVCVCACSLCRPCVRACVCVCFEFQFQFVVPRSAVAARVRARAACRLRRRRRSVRSFVRSALCLVVPFAGLVGISLLIWLVVFLASLSQRTPQADREIQN